MNHMTATTVSHKRKLIVHNIIFDLGLGKCKFPQT